MVDAVANAGVPDRRGDARSSAGASTLRFGCLSGPEALNAYDAFCRTALFAPPQSPHWLSCWARHCNPDIVVALAATDGETVFALALEVVADGAVTTARFAGGTHANGNFPAIAPGDGDAIGAGEIRGLLATLARMRPDIDLVRLERMVERFEGMPNPLCALPGYESPNPSLAVDISTGFDAVLARASSKRKRKKHRFQTRKFEAAGGLRRYRAGTRAETDHMLDAYFAMKAARFATMGIRNVFGEAHVQDFFRDLFAGGLEQKRPIFVLDGLEVGGKLRAITGCSLTETSMICEFGGFAEDELAFASPGEYLFFESIRDACDSGYRIYDFSVGDEPYKRLWCDLESRQVDVIVAFSAKGRAARFLIRAGACAKRFVKSNRFLWDTIKRFRRQVPAERVTQDG